MKVLQACKERLRLDECIPKSVPKNRLLHRNRVHEARGNARGRKRKILWSMNTANTRCHIYVMFSGCSLRIPDDEAPGLSGAESLEEEMLVCLQMLAIMRSMAYTTGEGV